MAPYERQAFLADESAYLMRMHTLGAPNNDVCFARLVDMLLPSTFKYDTLALCNTVRDLFSTTVGIKPRIIDEPMPAEGTNTTCAPSAQCSPALPYTVLCKLMFLLSA